MPVPVVYNLLISSTLNNNIIKTPASPNAQGISRISLLDLAAFNGVDIKDLILSAARYLSEVEVNHAITHFVLPFGAGYWDFNWSTTPAGLSYTHTISIDVPASAIDIHKWVALHERTSFAAYLVTNSGDVHLIGTEDLPCHFSGSRQVVGLNKYTFAFTCYALDFPYPLYPDSLPHFLTIP